ncbi:MAG: energy transducer TonB [Acidobacteria bacterium]|nr:energy transducer TonB [Acidobacteriota bacterium]
MTSLARSPRRRILFLTFMSALLAASAVRAQERVYTREEVSKPAVIVSMPDPVYHNSGEKLLDLTGAVKISVVLSASGRVTDLQVLEGLSKNQNFASLKAARRITFMPATKDGVPVSQSYVAVYSFQVTTQENGTTDELKGLTKFYVDADGDREVRGAITGELLKELPQLVVVDRPGQAECILRFEGSRTLQLAEGQDGRRSGVPLKVEHGHGWVIKLAGPDKRRFLMYYANSKESFIERAPTTNFVRAFVYEYKRANNLGK